MQVIAWPESAFDAPNPQLILRIHAVMNGLGGGAKAEFAPGAGNPRYATVSINSFFASMLP